MSKPSLHRHPSLEGSSSVGEMTSLRPSLFDTKDDFIKRIAPVGAAAIYFGGFSLAPQDAPLSRQALFKLSFLHRHFLQPAGLQIVVEQQTAILSGPVSSPVLVTMADILARQIEGIRQVKNEAGTKSVGVTAAPSVRESIQFLFATDQTLRSGVRIGLLDGRLTLEGEANSAAQKNWAEQLAEAAGGKINSQLTISPATTEAKEPPQIDDESLQALVLFRLRLVRDTEDLTIKVKANRGIVSLQGKVRTEALRQLVENLSRSTLGLRELRSSLSIAG